MEIALCGTDGTQFLSRSFEPFLGRVIEIPGNGETEGKPVQIRVRAFGSLTTQFIKLLGKKMPYIEISATINTAGEWQFVDITK